MGIIVFVFFGLVVGVTGGAMLPGFQRIGMLGALGQTLFGAVVGGFIGSVCTDSLAFDFSVGGTVGSMLGAFAALAAPVAEGKRRVAYRPRRLSRA
jgi:uncharacterized membrane protein YeaQ/YmgE (transglycosylase-associated protein family)